MSVNEFLGIITAARYTNWVRAATSTKNMRTVEIQLEASELWEQMAAMRVWLDQRRWEPSTFSYHQDGPGFRLRIDFKVAQEGEEFARRFGGRMNDSPLAA